MTTDPIEADTGSSLADLPLFRKRRNSTLDPALELTMPRSTFDEMLGRRTPATPVPAAPPAPTADADFYRDVTALRKIVADRLAKRLEDNNQLDENAKQELGRDIIQHVVREHVDTLITSGQSAWRAGREGAMAIALFDAMFRAGRIQPYLDRDDITDIKITGNDPVRLINAARGTVELADPVAETDAQLLSDIEFLAAREGFAFSKANHELEMPLPGRVRFAAIAFVTRRPRITIRLQAIKNVDLPTLRRLGTISTDVERLLHSAVKARKTIVVAGEGQGSGKTTMLRALAASLDPDEAIATIESDYELYLDDDPERHRDVLALQARRGTGEVTAAGTRAGHVSTGALFKGALRHSITRVIVGEVRGPEETAAMWEAMAAGNGSMSTVHADSARDVVERLVGLTVKDSSLSTEYAYRQVAQCIDLIVFLSSGTDEQGNKVRYVSEIIEPTRGEVKEGVPVLTNPVFVPGRDGRAVWKNAPSFIDDLRRVGFDNTQIVSTQAWGEN